MTVLKFLAVLYGVIAALALTVPTLGMILTCRRRNS